MVETKTDLLQLLPAHHKRHFHAEVMRTLGAYVAWGCTLYRHTCMPRRKNDDPGEGRRACSCVPAALAAARSRIPSARVASSAARWAVLMSPAASS